MVTALINDGLEAGIETTASNGSVVYAILTDPTRADSDNDGLDDAEELEFGTNPFLSDTDDDGLKDGDEVLTTGTDPTMTDTDGDGLDDRYELEHIGSESLDPLSTNVRMTTMENATDFGIGVVFGDFQPRDSVAWLFGTLTVIGRSGIPFIEAPVAVVTDLRDVAAAAIKRDWVSTGHAAVGLLPVGGDASVIAKKISKFTDRNPTLRMDVIRLINKIPDWSGPIKQDLRKVVWAKPWTDLYKKGYTDEELHYLAANRNDLQRLSEAVAGSASNRPPMKPAKNGRAGEEFLEREYEDLGYKVEKQKSLDTKICTNGNNKTLRRHDIQVRSKGE